MLKQAILSAALLPTAAAATTAHAQDTSAIRARQATTAAMFMAQDTQSTDDRPIIVGGAAASAARRRPTRASTAAAQTAATERAVRAAFDALMDAVTRTDLDAVMGAYWNSPQLAIFNNNGTVTRSWAQVRENLASRYPDLKDVKVATRDVRVQALSADAAVVTCLWTQSETYKGAPDTSSGRLTLVFRRVAGAWKVTHRHTSPDRPDPSLVPASERITTTTTTTTTTPARP